LPAETYRPVNVLIVHANEDESALGALTKHLGLLVREGLIETWSSEALHPGDDVAASVLEQLHRANVVIALLSSSFIACERCWENYLRAATELHDSGRLLLVPVLVRPVDWPRLARYFRMSPLPANQQPVSTWRQVDSGWLDVEQGLAAIFERVSVDSVTPSAEALRLRLASSELGHEIHCVLGSQAILGRSARCDLPIPLAPPTVSQRHMRLVYVRQLRHYAVQDFRSRHGTLVRGRNTEGLVRLHDRDEVQLGAALRFEFLGPSRDGIHTSCGVLRFSSESGKLLSDYALAPDPDLTLRLVGATTSFRFQRAQNSLLVHPQEGRSYPLPIGERLDLGSTFIQLERLSDA
jgi:hypothetical protein